ncbi:MAG: hypothetical protein IKV73_05710 [Clostridia bacterium]|nr:hypothetical protein [Clostridia bacterium]
MWTCTCQTVNNLADPMCCACHAPMPQSERTRIYRSELKKARNKLNINYMQPIIKRIGHYIDEEELTFGVIVKVLGLYLLELLRLAVKNRRVVLPIVGWLSFVVCMVSIHNPANERILAYTHQMSHLRRSSFSQSCARKLELAAGNIATAVQNPANTLNETKVGELKEKKDILKANAVEAKQRYAVLFEPVTDKAEECIDQLREKWNDFAQSLPFAHIDNN